jgi:predicted acyltransferase
MQDNKGEIYKILKMWVIVSLLLGAIAYPWTTVMPLNKKIWSMSFVFLTAGIAGLSLSFLTLFVDTFGSQHHQYGKVVNIIVQPFIWLGRNPLAVFVLMDALAIVLIKYILINNKSAWSHFYH